MTRPHPFDMLLSDFRDPQFTAIRAALGTARDIESFLLSPPALELLQELRPEEGFGEGVDDFVALVHAGYLYWSDGEQTVTLDAPATRALCEPFDRVEPDIRVSRVRYIQVSPRMIWGQLADDAPFEPLDGWFVVPVGESMRVVACFGVHAERPGVSVAVAEGGPPVPARRLDGTPLFAPTMPGGAEAKLHAVTAPEELLLLGYRSARREELS